MLIAEYGDSLGSSFIPAYLDNSQDSRNFGFGDYGANGTKEQVFLAKNRGKIFLVHTPGNNKKSFTYWISPSSVLDLIAKHIGVTSTQIQAMVHPATNKQVDEAKYEGQINGSNYTSHLNLINKLKPEYKMGSGFYNAPKTKKLYVPGKMYADWHKFIKEFPHLKFPLFMATVAKAGLFKPDYEEVGDAELGKHFYNHYRSRALMVASLTVPTPEDWEEGDVRRVIPLDITPTDWSQKIDTYNDMLRFAISPQNPLDIDIYAAKPSGGIRVSHPWGPNQVLKKRAEAYARINNFAYQAALVVLFKLGKDAYLKAWVNRGNTTGGGIRNVQDNDYSWAAKSANKYIDEFLSYTLKAFKARTQSEWKKFKQEYRDHVNSVDQVSEHTICYTITNQPPPVPEEAQKYTRDVRFWSALFQGKMGNTVLSAVAYNMPVRVKTMVVAFKNPEKSSYIMQHVKRADIEIFKLAFQDFDIEIGPKNNILVRYSRGYEIQAIIHKKHNAWLTILIIVIIIVAIIITIVSYGTAAPAAGAMVGTATGAGGVVTAAVPVVATVGIGGTATLGTGAIMTGVMTAAKLAYTGYGMMQKKKQLDKLKAAGKISNAEYAAQKAKLEAQYKNEKKTIAHVNKLADEKAKKDKAARELAVNEQAAKGIKHVSIGKIAAAVGGTALLANLIS